MCLVCQQSRCAAMQAQLNDEYFLYEPVRTPCWSGWFEPDFWTFLQSGPVIGYLFWNWVLSLFSWEFFFVIIIPQSHHNFCTETKQILEVDIILCELHVCYSTSFDSILQPCFFSFLIIRFLVATQVFGQHLCQPCGNCTQDFATTTWTTISKSRHHIQWEC
jgi:hypothetical protein